MTAEELKAKARKIKDTAVETAKDIGTTAKFAYEGARKATDPYNPVVMALKAKERERLLNEERRRADRELEKRLANPGSYKKGGKVKKTGMALVHKGEVVLTAKQAAKAKKPMVAKKPMTPKKGVAIVIAVGKPMKKGCKKC